MLQHRPTAWLRPVLSLLALAALLSLAACGGGSGAPNNPYQPGPSAPPAVVVQPASINIFSGVPTTLTIISGTGPFSAFSDTPSVLPVSQSVAGNTIVLLGNQVPVDTPVRVTVRDSLGQSVDVPVTVKPAPLLNNLTFAPTGNDCGADLCSGQAGTVKATALAPGNAPLVGRQIRFDVIYGPVAFNTGNPGAPQAQTITVVTDNNGVAQVSIQATVNATTQPAQVRATDLTTGNQQIVNFNVVNNTTSSQSPIVIVPSTANIQGAYNNVCSSGFRVDYYVYGGTPPYSVQATFPQSVQMLNNVVSSSGGFFSVITNGSCVNPLVFTITDAAGKQTTASLQNVPGQQAPPAPTPPATLTISPGTLSVTGCAGKTFTFVVTGGTQPYNLTTNPGPPTVGTPAPGGNANTFTISVPAAPPFAGTIAVTALDSGSPAQTATGTLTCN
jgi:hypothetical protein